VAYVQTDESIDMKQFALLQVHDRNTAIAACSHREAGAIVGDR
jgi:hypothetical protein